jgi:hypothetical protein
MNDAGLCKKTTQPIGASQGKDRQAAEMKKALQDFPVGL